MARYFLETEVQGFEPYLSLCWLVLGIRQVEVKWNSCINLTSCLHMQKHGITLNNQYIFKLECTLTVVVFSVPELTNHYKSGSFAYYIWHRPQPQYSLPLHSVRTVGNLTDKISFHECAWGRGNQSSSNEIACYNKILFNFNDIILVFSYSE